MQRYMLFYLLVGILSGQILCMEPGSYQFALHHAQEELEPPDCFKNLEEVSQESLFEFDDDFCGEVFFDDQDGIFADSLFSTTPMLPPLYYLMIYDFNIKNVRTFSADTKSELLKHYLICFINEANTPTSRDTQVHLHAKAPSIPIKLQDSHYELVCNAGGGLCRHTEIAQSRESLAVNLFAHFVVEHKKDSAWYKNISKSIAGTLEEAWVKLYGRRF